jgi:oligopeptidase B
VTEWEELGNPLEDPEAYARIRSYSPYENVGQRRYPPVLAIASLNDTRVRYHEAAKWIARLRAVGTGGPFLLHTELQAGHRGKTGRYEQWRASAMIFAWILDVVAQPDRESSATDAA